MTYGVNLQSGSSDTFDIILYLQGESAQKPVAGHLCL